MFSRRFGFPAVQFQAAMSDANKFRPDNCVLSLQLHRCRIDECHVAKDGLLAGAKHRELSVSSGSAFHSYEKTKYERD